MPNIDTAYINRPYTNNEAVNKVLNFFTRPYTYAKRHFGMCGQINEIARKTLGTNPSLSQPGMQFLEKAKHVLLGIVDCIPIVGQIAAVVEAKFHPVQEHKVSTTVPQKLKYSDLDPKYQSILPEEYKHGDFVFTIYERADSEPQILINWDEPLDKLRTDEVIAPSEQWIIDSVYDALETIDQVFKANGVKYCLDGGTQLGATRHKGVIPWDDDGDLLALESDREKIKSLIPQFEKLGYKVHYTESWDKFEISGPGAHKLPGHDCFGVPWVDVFLIRPGMGEETGRYVYSGDVAYRDWHHKEYITHDEWKEVQNIPFGHLELPGHAGKNAERYLTTLYKKEWNDVGFSSHRHTKTEGTTFSLNVVEKVRIQHTCPKHSKFMTKKA